MRDVSVSEIDGNAKKEDASIQERMLLLLSKQYNHTQDYCNAQIALENAWQLSQQNKNKQESESDLLQAVTVLQKATRRVQDDFQSLETMVLCISEPASNTTTTTTATNRNHRQRDAGCHQWQARACEHLQRTRRILSNLQTTRQSSAAGIPFPRAVTAQEDALVALATLRASVVQLQAALEASGQST
jgi:hypothetical protein